MSHRVTRSQRRLLLPSDAGPLAALPLDIMALLFRVLEAHRLTNDEEQRSHSGAQPAQQAEKCTLLPQQCPQWSLAATCKAWRDAARDASAWTTLWVPAAVRLTPNSIARCMESSLRFERVTSLIFNRCYDSMAAGSPEFYARLAAALPSLKALALSRGMLSLHLDKLAPSLDELAPALGAKLQALSIPAGARDLIESNSLILLPPAFTAPP